MNHDAERDALVQRTIKAEAECDRLRKDIAAEIQTAGLLAAERDALVAALRAIGQLTASWRYGLPEDVVEAVRQVVAERNRLQATLHDLGVELLEGCDR